MDNRGYGSGSSNYNMYGGAGFGDTHMKSGMSNSNADVVIAKINQRLDMLSQLEGGMRGGRNDRFDQYESYDSRSSAPRDLYRSGSFGFGDSRADAMAYGAAGRDSFSGSGWGMGPRSQLGGERPGGRGFGRTQDDYMAGGRGHSHSGQGSLPSLLSNRMYPERGFQFKGPQFGGNQWGNRQQNRKRAHNRQQGKQKDRMGPQSPSEEPVSKVFKTESIDDEETTELKEEKTDKGTPATGESDLVAEDESSEVKSEEKPSMPMPRSRRRRGFFERTANGPSRSLTRVTFACSICKFRSFYSEDMEVHLESKFHKDHFQFLTGTLNKPTADFLKEYLMDKFKKTTQRISQLPNHSDTICQVLKDQDLTRDIGMEHFIKREEAAHCTACDIYIPMQQNLIQQHLKSSDHNYNRKAMMEQSKWSCASVARSILNHKVISKKLESFLKGENPFTEEHDQEDHEDSAVLEKNEDEPKPEDGVENLGEGAPEGAPEGALEAAGNDEQPEGEHQEQSGDGGEEEQELDGDWAEEEEEEEVVEGVEMGEEEGAECLEAEDQEV